MPDLLKRVLCCCLAGSLLFVAVGCGKKQTPAVKPPVAVDLAQAAPSQLEDGIEVTGSLEPKFATDVKTQLSGLVQEVYVTQWVRVRKGQALARIDASESEALAKRAEAGVLAAKAHLAQMQVALNRAEREETRAQKLKEAGLATQQALDDSRTETAAARARLDAAQAQVRVAGEESRQARTRHNKGLVTAPIDGVVALREVNVGDLTGDAAAARPIFRIVDNRILNLTVTVASADSARVKVGQPLAFTVDALPNRQFQGQVMFVNPELSSADRSLKVIAEVDNRSDELKGGLFAKGRIVTGNRSNVLLVPRSVLTGWDNATRRATLFVADGQIARQRQVTTGAVNGDLVEIVEGLKNGEQYVARGGFALQDGDRIAPSPKDAAR